MMESHLGPQIEYLIAKLDSLDETIELNCNYWLTTVSDIRNILNEMNRSL